jgi:CRP-like cAMP-binding protein
LSGDRSSFLGVNVHVWRRVVISLNGPRNRLLAAFPKTDVDLLRPHLELVRLDVHQVLEEPGHLISHVYFIESGLVSMVGTTKPNHRIEVGMIGYEGMTGTASY